MAGISIIIPVLDESSQIVMTLRALQCFRASGHEIIVVDGGSDDDSVALAEPLCDAVVSCGAGRAKQMNAGAEHASGRYLFFLHIDTSLDRAARHALLDTVTTRQPEWGFFKVKLGASGIGYSVIGSMMNWRSKLTRVATGDQCLLVSESLYRAVGGFPSIDLMEDIAMSKLLRARAVPHIFESPVVTSARRWQQRGIWRTVVQMWMLRAAYALGVSPRRLHSLYYGNTKA